MSTTATQAAQDVLERLNRAATLFGDPDASTDPATGNCARIAPIRTESTRDICPAPTPTV